MKPSKWILASAVLATMLSTEVFAENQPRNRQDGDAAIYTQGETRGRAQTWNNGFRDQDDHYRRDDDRDAYRDHNERYRGNRDRRDRDRARGDHDDRGR